MGIVRHVLLPSFLLPFRLFGGRTGADAPSTCRFTDLDYSETDSDAEDDNEDEENTKEANQRRHFMNYEFSSSMRSTPVNDNDVQFYNQSSTFNRMGSTKFEFEASPFSATPENLDVDVIMKPSAFAFHMVPNQSYERAFCSRDDSEIAVRSPLFNNEEDEVFNGVDSEALHANVVYLYPKHFCDDMEIGMFSEKKTPLRHMGSAIVYRRELNGRPSSCVPSCESFSSFPCASPDLSQSLRLNSFKERNKIVRLESIVGRVQIRPNSRTEFGVMDARGCELLEMKMNYQASMSPSPVPRQSKLDGSTTPTTITNSARELFVKSYPVSFLSRLSEEDSLSDFDADLLPQDSAEELTGRASRQLYHSKSGGRRCPSSRSAYKFRISSADFEKNGAMNPHYECPDDLYPTEYGEDLMLDPYMSPRFDLGGGSLADLSIDTRPKTVINDNRRTFLLERYLAASFVRDQMTPTNM
eukprot:g4155.t1